MSITVHQRLSRRLAISYLVLGVLLAPAVRPDAAHAAVQVGQPAPDFTKTDLDGVPRTLSSYQGGIVVLFFLGYG